MTAASEASDADAGPVPRLAPRAALPARRGLGEHDTAPFRQALLAGAPAAHLVSESLLDTFTASGTPGDCCASLARFAATGLDAPAFLIPPGVDFERQLQLVADTLVPFWKTLKGATP